ncbi:heat-inducible transcriptional repressor HrcA [Gleimia hominis]|uniref:heat-inducible transcriptional repressor HrcA n=1 Tax=Gleimia hominis TaxID=595468 RepID=UPI000C7FFE37|nr:heat-inducible transcriptional repressor HrcA [Gleimia hominis]WIK64897.1 heat-inducible transcriptional repressor HrcA [Gleimia hominis]
MSTHARRLDVLRAIVSDYVSTREPVGSAMLARKYDLGVSPATIRNDMSILEEEGLIFQPHTSAGRIPTVKGYRLFVDQLAEFKPLSAPERRALEVFLTDAADIDDVVDRTVRLLSHLTRQVAIVQYPQHVSANLVGIELVPIGAGRLLVIVIADDGEVAQQVVPDFATDTEQIHKLREHFNQQLVGAPLEQVVAQTDVLTDVDTPLLPVATAISQAIAAASDRKVDDRIVVAGTANLARSGVDFRHTIVPVLDALEEQVALLRLFSALPADNVTVSLGRENQHAGLSETAVVAGSYGDETTTAHLAVVGPLRMDYPGAMNVVRSVGQYLSHFLKNKR